MLMARNKSRWINSNEKHKWLEFNQRIQLYWRCCDKRIVLTYNNLCLRWCHHGQDLQMGRLHVWQQEADDPRSDIPTLPQGINLVSTNESPLLGCEPIMDVMYVISPQAFQGPQEGRAVVVPLRQQVRLERGQYQEGHIHLQPPFPTWEWSWSQVSIWMMSHLY